MKLRIHSTSVTIHLFLIAAASLVAQGPLIPPGAPAPTMKTLAQIEPRTPISALPFTITTPGAYYLTGSLTGAAGQAGITINADNVIIDLGGFELIGSAGAAAIGIRLASPFTNAVIRNGTVRNWTSHGLSSNGGFLRVENVRSRNNTGNGFLFGPYGSAIDCVALGNGSDGFLGAEGCQLTRCLAYGQTAPLSEGFSFSGECLLTECTASANGGHGFSAGQRGVLRQCLATYNGLDGITGNTGCTLEGCAASANGGDGIDLDATGTLTGCVSISNTGSGIVGGANSALAHCAANSNASTGISVSDGCTLAHCSAYANGGTAGLSAGFGCTISHCISRNNTSTATSSWGISVSGECTILACTVTNTGNTNGTPTSTTGGGIVTGIGSLVKDCTVQGCKGDGIRVSSRCTVTGNQCEGNGAGSGDGAGVHATGTDCRLDGNHVSANDRGLHVSGTGCLIIRNTAAGNTTNYEIVADNRYGPIINISAGGGLAVSGSAAADNTGTTHPWANFTH
jgi:parallel beta-helix repeat protein